MPAITSHHSSIQRTRVSSSGSYALPSQCFDSASAAAASGARAGSEVVQLYLHDPLSRLRRPEQELVAFEKVRLAPGESRTLRFTLLPLPGRIAQPAGRTVLRIAASTPTRERIREIETALAA